MSDDVEKWTHFHDTTVSAWEETQDWSNIRKTHAKIVVLMRNRGFKMYKNRPRAISAEDWYGKKGDLEVRVGHTSGRTFEVVFFQDVANIENRNGGEYEFDKLHRMPTAMQVRCITELYVLVRRLIELGYPLNRHAHLRPGRPLQLEVARIARGGLESLPEDPLERFNSRWDSEYERKSGRHRFERDENGWPVARECGNSGPPRDRDGNGIRVGQTKYVRPCYGEEKGRLLRVTVYPNINNQWEVTSNGTILTCVDGRDLFDCESPELEPRRLVPDQQKRLVKEAEGAIKAGEWKRLVGVARAGEKLQAEAACST